MITITMTDRDLDQAIGQRVQALRRDAGMNQQELADAMDIEQATISKWERGTNSMSLRMILTAAEALRVHPNEILSAAVPAGDDSPVDLARELRRAARLIQEATGDTQDSSA